MSIEKDILKKLELVRKDVKDAKKAGLVKNEDTKHKTVKDERESRSPFRHKMGEGKSTILLLFDATGSMQSLWDATKDIIEEMIKRITNVGNVKIKCVAYRDYCDGDKIFQCSKWYNDAEPLLNFLGKIRCDGGGDEPEAVEDALELAYNEKEENVTRVILIGDAPPHSFEKATTQASRLGNKGIPVFSFRVGFSPSTSESFNQIARASNGRYADISNYKDLLDFMSVTIIHDVGGSEEVEKYIKRYDTSEGVKEYSKSLPSYKK